MIGKSERIDTLKQWHEWQAIFGESEKMMGALIFERKERGISFILKILSSIKYRLEDGESHVIDGMIMVIGNLSVENAYEFCQENLSFERDKNITFLILRDYLTEEACQRIGTITQLMRPLEC